MSLTIGPISSKLFYALKMVESGGDVDAVGDGGLAIGPYQITRCTGKMLQNVTLPSSLVARLTRTAREKAVWSIQEKSCRWVRVIQDSIAVLIRWKLYNIYCRPT